jgi:hypothetical protein
VNGAASLRLRLPPGRWAFGAIYSGAIYATPFGILANNDPSETGPLLVVSVR